MDLDRTIGTARRALVGTGVTGAAVLLSLAGATPALAGHSHGHGHGHAYGHQHDGQQSPDDDTAGPTSSDADGGTGGHGRSAAAHAAHGAHGRSATATGAARSDGHNPPGNNGTVFIHDVAGDFSPHNVPHVPCTFYADFFGFDLDQQVTVSFAGQAPTGMGTPLGGTWTGTVSDDDAGGAGQDFDLELPFSADTLGVTSLGAPHPKQGYHVKMTVLTNEPGGRKSKVFWIGPCADTAAATPEAGTTDTETGGEDVATGSTADTETTDAGATDAGATDTQATDTQADVLAGSLTSGGTARGATTPSTAVLGEHFYRGMASGGAAAAAGSLPFTGAEVGGLLVAGTAALGGGAALMVAGRRRRTAPVSPTD